MRTIGDAIARGWLAVTGGNGETEGEQPKGRKSAPSPWGSGGDSPEEPSAEPGPTSGEPEEKPRAPGPRNPWLPGSSGAGRPGGGDSPRRTPGLDDLFRPRPGKGGGGFGGGKFPGLPQRPDGRSWLPLIVGGVFAVWLLSTTTHMLGPKEQGIVTTLGKYSRTIQPGVSWTLPWPIENVRVEDVTSIKRDTIPEGEAEKLMLTSDQNLVDISYLVRWNIKDLKLYAFQLADPDATVKEVAEAAMRASVAEESLNSIFSGAGRANTENAVETRMQQVLDAYRSGIAIQGVQIKKTDPPSEVMDAFKDVSAAQQEAQGYVNQAEAVAQQVLARAQGDAASFDKVYAQYKLAPEVTRQRMYYETMERVLRKTDKVVIEAPGVNSYLPLPELKRKADQAPDVNSAAGQ